MTPPAKENRACNPESSFLEKEDQPHDSSWSHGLAQETQIFRDYAAGGHVVSDMNLAALANRENAAARNIHLEKEDLISFGAGEDEGLAERIDNVRLVRTMSNGRGGSRGLWKGTFEVPRPKTASPKEEANLLDL